MRIEIDSVLTVGKGVNIKREKGADDIEIVVAHLKFSGMFVPREAIDEFVGCPIGWSQMALFDEFGAPIGHLEIALPKFSAQVTGVVRGVNNNDRITFTEALLDEVVISLTKEGGIVAGALAWSVAGDEVSDLEPLLGRICAVKWVVQDAGQKDLLKVAA